ncbi:MAG: TIGR04283 family arsenosugar biosynthesis glycosyltransferase [Methyloglobulus sp.]|nr:glycosyltransferase family 2 protein [Methyloglobulus sp.]
MANISIIIPTLNEAQSIVNCICPLQPLRNLCEIIVVDGCSTDNTRQLVQDLVDTVIISAQGRAIQMNAGAQHSKGKVLLFLHADTLLPPSAHNLIAESIDRGRQWGRFDVQLSGRSPLLKVIAFFMNWRSRLTGIATGDQAIFVSKQLFDAVGHYPEIALMEDIALCTHLNKISSPICLKSPVISSGRRWEQFGIIKTILLMWSLRLRYFFGADPDVLANLYSRGKFWKT